MLCLSPAFSLFEQHRTASASAQSSTAHICAGTGWPASFRSHRLADSSEYRHHQPHGGSHPNPPPVLCFGNLQVHDWTSAVVEGVLKNLQQANKPFKYVVTCIIMQINGAGLHTASTCFWDTKTDGWSCLPTPACLCLPLPLPLLVCSPVLMATCLPTHNTTQAAALCDGRT